MAMKIKMAGNTNVGCVRKNNEDNFCVSADLQSGLFATAVHPWGAEQAVDLGPKGVLLVVADGMGGTNAGEVASERAVACVCQFFAPERITADVTASTSSIRRFMEQAIEACDREVKEWGDSHPESRGMGTTIVIGWIIDGKLYVAWCGDSRAYVCHGNKVYQVTKDHSFVQLLVDQGMITREQAFDHPRGNIIIRSLSHGQPAAIPECLSVPYILCDGDIVLLCSDGLSGMLHDEEIGSVICSGDADAEQIVDRLIEGACKAGGKDNVTVVLCKVESGGTGSDKSSGDFFAATEAALNGPGIEAAPQPARLFPEEPAPPQSVSQPPAPRTADKKIIISVIVTLAVLFACVAGWFVYKQFCMP